MCGILYIRRRDNKSPVRSLVKRYKQQSHRGTQGFGFVAIKDHKIIGYIRTETEADILVKLQDYHDADEILFHHRLPTSTKNVAEAAHPIKVSNDMLDFDYYVVHNGVIRNPNDVKKKHEDLGFEYTTELEEVTIARHRKSKRIYSNIEKTITTYNDSEALAIELALHIDQKKPSIDVYGTIAFIVLQVDKKTNTVVSMYHGRNSGNPLRRTYLAELFAISSEAELKNSVVVETGTIFKDDYNTETFLEFPFKPDVTNYTGYGTYGGSSYTKSLPSGASYRGEWCHVHREYEDADIWCDTEWCRTCNRGVHRKYHQCVEDIDYKSKSYHRKFDHKLDDDYDYDPMGPESPYVTTLFPDLNDADRIFKKEETTKLESKLLELRLLLAELEEQVEGIGLDKAEGMNVFNRAMSIEEEITKIEEKIEQLNVF